MSVYSKFDDISLPVPPIVVTGDTLRYISRDLPQFLDSQYLALLDFISAVQSEFLISNNQIVDVSADKVANNTQFLNTVFVGAESKIKLDGPNNLITVDDNQGTPRTRVKIGKLGTSATNEYGIQVIDAAGSVKFQTGTSTFLDGGIISADTITATQIDANTITATEIAADTITADEIASTTITAAELSAGAVTAGKIDVSTLSAISADLGTITAGTITGGLIQTASSGARVELATSGLNAYKADGTQTVDINIDGTFRFGTAAGDRIEWDNTNFTVTGDIIATGNIQDGAITVPTVTTGSKAANGLNTYPGNLALTVSTRGGNVIGTITVNATIGGSGGDDDRETCQLRCQIDGNTFINTVAIQSAGGGSQGSISNQFVSGTFLDGNPAGSISSAADTTYTIALDVPAVHGPDITSGVVLEYSVTLVTLETFK
tara:strand:+ start:3423 stop:4724 length:1302 start_codon:yes stop_codon:yes gene_type:complete